MDERTGLSLAARTARKARRARLIAWSRLRWPAISARLWIGFILGAVLPLLGLSLASLAAFESALTDTVLSKIASIADKKAVQVNACMAERLDDVATLAARESLKEALRHAGQTRRQSATAAMEPSMAHDIAQHVNASGYADLLLIDAAGKVIFSAKRELDPGTSLQAGAYRDTALGQAWRRSVEKRQAQSTRFARHQPWAEGFTSFVVAPVLDAEHVIGAVALQLDFDSLSGVAADRTGLGDTGETVLGQLEEGSVVYMSKLMRAPDALGTAVPASLAAWPMSEALAGRQGQGRVRDYSGVAVLAAWRYMPGLGWGMTVKMDEEEALQPVIRLRRLIILVLCCVFILAALAVHLMRRSLSSVSLAGDGAGKVVNYLARSTDLSDRKAVEARMEQLAHYDTLTGLLNRFSLQQALERAVAQAQAEGTALSLVFLDLDRFKAVNDALGHAVGDELLLRVGQRIRNCVREQDIVARPGGDEFVILLAATEPATHRVAEKLLESLRQPYNIRGHRIHTTPSLGIAAYPADGNSAEALMRSADTAMYYAKSQGRDNVQFFTPELNRAWIERMNLERELRQAIEADELVLYYQPKLDLRSGAISRVEALLRWPHARLGFVSPARFIPVAEDCGLITLLGAWVLNKACAELSAWRGRGLDDVTVAVNLSAHELRSPDILPRVTGALEQAGLQPRWLEVEVTESAAMSDPARTIEHLGALRRMGLGIAIDDFGTGHSSLSYLKLLPATTLKLDRSLVRDIETQATDLAICQATIALAHTLGLAVVAEGVETAAQKQLLSERGCDLLQGYHICEPLPAEAMFDFIVRWNRIELALKEEHAAAAVGEAA